VRSVISWEEPNREGTPRLHIASRGDRYSTLTGVWWLDDNRYVVNHRSGLCVALFDRDVGDQPVYKALTPHPTDDIAAAQVGEDRWLVALSGCWASAYSLYELGPDGFRLLKTIQQSKLAPLMRGPLRNFRSFAHGVGYGPDGELVIAYHTGFKARITSVPGGRTWRLPAPWGARDACFDQDGTLYVVATAANASLTAYQDTRASIWKLVDDEFELLVETPGAHFDTAAIYQGCLYTNNQVEDNVSVYDLASARQLEPIADEAIDFPHGVDVSPSGVLAVTNYGNSTVVLRDLDAPSGERSTASGRQRADF
jgi:hypothetical protein